MGRRRPRTPGAHATSEVLQDAVRCCSPAAQHPARTRRKCKIRLTPAPAGRTMTPIHHNGRAVCERSTPTAGGAPSARGGWRPGPAKAESSARAGVHARRRCNDMRSTPQRSCPASRRYCTTFGKKNNAFLHGAATRGPSPSVRDARCP
jgi:hypothetical protein